MEGIANHNLGHFPSTSPLPFTLLLSLTLGEDHNGTIWWRIQSAKEKTKRPSNAQSYHTYTSSYFPIPEPQLSHTLPSRASYDHTAMQPGRPGKFDEMLRRLWANYCSPLVLGAETSQQVAPPTSPADPHSVSPAVVVSCIYETARLRRKKERKRHPTS